MANGLFAASVEQSSIMVPLDMNVLQHSESRHPTVTEKRCCTFFRSCGGFNGAVYAFFFVFNVGLFAGMIFTNYFLASLLTETDGGGHVRPNCNFRVGYWVQTALNVAIATKAVALYVLLAKPAKKALGASWPSLVSFLDTSIFCFEWLLPFGFGFKLFWQLCGAAMLMNLSSCASASIPAVTRTPSYMSEKGTAAETESVASTFPSSQYYQLITVGRVLWWTSLGIYCFIILLLAVAIRLCSPGNAFNQDASRIMVTQRRPVGFLLDRRQSTATTGTTHSAHSSGGAAQSLDITVGRHVDDSVREHDAPLEATQRGSRLKRRDLASLLQFQYQDLVALNVSQRKMMNQAQQPFSEITILSQKYFGVSEGKGTPATDYPDESRFQRSETHNEQSSCSPPPINASCPDSPRCQMQMPSFASPMCSQAAIDGTTCCRDGDASLERSNLSLEDLPLHTYITAHPTLYMFLVGLSFFLITLSDVTSIPECCLKRVENGSLDTYLNVGIYHLRMFMGVVCRWKGRVRQAFWRWWITLCCCWFKSEREQLAKERQERRRKKNGRTARIRAMLNEVIVVDTTCCICCMDYSPLDLLLLLPCPSRHYFHKSCATSWLRQHATCPLCRDDIAVELWKLKHDF